MNGTDNTQPLNAITNVVIITTAALPCDNCHDIIFFFLRATEEQPYVPYPHEHLARIRQDYYSCKVFTTEVLGSPAIILHSASLVPRPPSEKSRKGLVTRMAMPRPIGIQSVTQSRVNVYTRGDNWSCMPLNSCTYSTMSSLNKSDTVPSRSTLLPRERRAAQYKSRITTGS